MTVSITLANATTRNTVVTDDSKTVAEVLSENGFATTGVTIHANGSPVADLNKTLAAASIADGAMLMSVPFQKAGLN